MSHDSELSLTFAVMRFGAAILTRVSRLVMAGINALLFPPASLLSAALPGGKVAWFILLYAGANVSVAALLQLSRSLATGASGHRLVLAMSLSMALLHLLVLLGRVLVVLDERAVMNGVVHERLRDFDGKVIHFSLGALAISFASYALFATLALAEADHLHRGALVACREAGCDRSFLQLMLLFLHEGIPFAERAFMAADVQVGLDFAGVAGTALGNAIFIVNATLLYYAVTLSVGQWYQYYAMFDALAAAEEGEDSTADIRLLQMRLARAPSMKRRILDMAVSHSYSPVVRRRAISICQHARILTFPQTFVHNLHREGDKGNQLWGLKVARRLLADEELRQVYTAEHMQVLLRKIGQQCRGSRKNRHSEAVLNQLEELRKAASTVRRLTEQRGAGPANGKVGTTLLSWLTRQPRLSLRG